MLSLRRSAATPLLAWTRRLEAGRERRDLVGARLPLLALDVLRRDPICERRVVGKVSAPQPALVASVAAILRDGGPAAPTDAAWDTNVNKTLGGVVQTSIVPGYSAGQSDPYLVTPNSRFSFGYNDWGLGNAGSLSSPADNLGCGADQDGQFGSYGPMKEAKIVAPTQLINVADTRALPVGQNTGSWEANLDPTDTPNSSQGGDGGQEPCNRHNYKVDILFCDAHVEKVQRNDKAPGNPNPMFLIDSTENNPWRQRWNNDNKLHNELTWDSVASTASSPMSLYKLDPSF